MSRITRYSKIGVLSRKVTGGRKYFKPHLISSKDHARLIKQLFSFRRQS